MTCVLTPTFTRSQPFLFCFPLSSRTGWNTVSNLVIVAAGAWGLAWGVRHGHRPRFLVLAALVAVVGLGSAAFHGTLRFRMQMLDELPMVYCLTSWLYCWLTAATKQPPRWLAPLLLAADAAFTVLHVCFGFVEPFQVLFGGLTVLGLRHVYLVVRLPTADRSVRLLASVYTGALALGFALWVLEQHACTALRGLPANPQLHAWWHVCVGVNTCFCVPLVCYARGLRVGAAPRLCWEDVWFSGGGGAKKGGGYRGPLLPTVRYMAPGKDRGD